jgi:type 1 glutamine amidotransferase
MKFLALAFLILTGALPISAREVLIVADEFPAMQVMADKLKSEENITPKVINQKELPESLKDFQAVVVYIHRDLAEKAENAFIDYAENGGKLVLLHHSISSGKRKNAHWFKFLGVSLPDGDLSKGGYKWIEGVNFSLVNLNPSHFIMTNGITWPEQIAYSTTNSPVGAEALPGFTLRETEVYLNHVHIEPHTLLMGLKFTEPSSGKTYMQDTAGWLKRTGKGWVVYLMPGHSKHDFETPTYGRIVANAVIWRTEPAR